MKTFKTEIKPKKDQIIKLFNTHDVCRYIYNLYISTNIERYENKEPFMTGYSFSNYLNNEYREVNPDKSWIREVSSKAVKQSILDAEIAFKRFFKKLARFPRFKKKGKCNISVYFPKNNKTDLLVERHRIKIPTLGWTRLKEFGYIPPNSTVKSVRVTYKAGRWFVSCLVDIEADRFYDEPYTDGIGVDLGISNLAITSTGLFHFNINKTKRIKDLTKKLKREQRKFSRKIEFRKVGVSATYSNIEKQKLKIQKIYFKLSNIRKDYINQIISTTVKTKPDFITIEDLNIRGMLKNRCLSKAISEQLFYYFKERLTFKCLQHGIQLRVVDRFYPSSKLCSCCGVKKVDLKLNDRVYSCPSCGFVLDRDVNAAVNLKQATEFKIAI